VVDVAPIEAGEVVVAQPPRRRYEAGAGGAVEVPLADVAGAVSGVAETLSQTDLLVDVE
ncbi:uncharacterized protein METZ01_LOCUS475735, partial [marine metagenome]